ncbi:hypothetical protein SAMN05428985_102529 [Nocardioides sp. YR527]|uniref:hypothetical protein n=1 Tax=Nocardioides sp. YR527 TaxID=1881028 RepID=UPI00088D0212|nr:hypothetical protein [Nocardioides sp. YR527]SDK07032.1 hypothetical protein SAMN05428985_102529 [Nocardioides sp. YR527]
MTTKSDLYGMLDEADGLIEDLRGAVNFVLQHLPFYVPDSVTDKILSEWDKLSAKATTELSSLRTSVDESGEEVSLRAAADGWSDRVKAGISGLAGRIEEGALTAEDATTFQGLAADAYRAIIPGQKSAIEAIAGHPDDISSGLDELAGAIQTWTIAYGVALVALLGGIASAIAGVAASETGVGAIIGLAAAIVCFATLAGAILVAESELSNAVQAVEGTWRSLLNEWTGFDGQAWPNAVFPH